MGRSNTASSSDTFSLAPFSYDDWLKRAEAVLGGRGIESLDHVDEDGLHYPALSTSAHRHDAMKRGGMGDVLSSRGACRWMIAQYLEPEGDSAVLNRAMLDELEGGTGRLIFTPDQELDVIPKALDGVFADAVFWGFEGAEAPLKALAVLEQIWGSQNVNPDAARGHLGLDVVAGVLEGRIDSNAGMTQAKAWIDEVMPKISHWPRLGVFTLGGGALHRFGLTSAQELAVNLAHGVGLMRLMLEAGYRLEQGAGLLEVQVAMDAQIYASIAKGRAIRLVMDKLFGSLGLDGSQHVRFHGVTSDRMLSAIDQDTNMLRSGTAMLAMALSGFDAITARPHDWLSGSTPMSRRIARNSHHLLADEAQLAHVADPAQGSYFIDSATAALGEKAWQLFQQIEKQGGIFKALEADMFTPWAEAAIKARQDPIDQGSEALLGITLHPLKASPKMTCLEGKSGKRGGDCRPSAPWEDLRWQFEQILPRCLMLDVGKDVKASASSASRWLHAVGIEGVFVAVKNTDEAAKTIASAQPDVLILGGGEADDYDGLLVIEAERFDSNQKGDMLALCQEIYNSLKAAPLKTEHES